MANDKKATDQSSRTERPKAMKDDGFVVPTPDEAKQASQDAPRHGDRFHYPGGESQYNIDKANGRLKKL